jgi:hypothetical protein
MQNIRAREVKMRPCTLWLLLPELSIVLLWISRASFTCGDTMKNHSVAMVRQRILIGWYLFVAGLSHAALLMTAGPYAPTLTLFFLHRPQ